MLPPFEAFLDKKRKIRRAIEEARIPYTFVSANCFGAYFINYLLHPSNPDNEDITVYGSGEAKCKNPSSLYLLLISNPISVCCSIVMSFCRVISRDELRRRHRPLHDKSCNRSKSMQPYCDIQAVDKCSDTARINLKVGEENWEAFQEDSCPRRRSCSPIRE